MQSAERRAQNAECRTNGNGQPLAVSVLRSALCTLRFRSAFTLIELMVAVGLMAILLTMIATIFFEATQAFRVARASIEIHESARAAFNALVDDLTAAEFTYYGTGSQGFIGQSGQGPYNTGTVSVTQNNTAITGTGTVWGANYPNVANVSPGDIFIGPDGALYGISSVTSPTTLTLAEPYAGTTQSGAAYTILRGLTFTTLAPQPSAQNAAATEAAPQLALVRYDLEFDGGSAKPPGSQTPQPTYWLMKRVAFPNTSNSTVNLNAFDWTAAPQPPAEPIAFHVLSMNVRFFPETGTAGGSSTNTLVRSSPSFPRVNSIVSLTNEPGVGQSQQTVTADDGTTMTVSPGWTTVGSWPCPQPGDCYAIYAWTSGNAPFQGGHLPALVEVTLNLTDHLATRSFMFTQRFYILASER
jgi:prepilin-type N-terminal cleavage/methylation domain-containing protein